MNVRLRWSSDGQAVYSRTRPWTQSSFQSERGAHEKVLKPSEVGLTPRVYSVRKGVGKLPQPWEPGEGEGEVSQMVEESSRISGTHLQ